MTTNNLISWGAALAWGGVLSLFYFGGLWWTLKTLPGKARPGLWLTFSYVVRIGGALLGFWLVMRRSLMAFSFTFIAFFIVRFIMARKLGVMGRRETSHGD